MFLFESIGSRKAHVSVGRQIIRKKSVLLGGRARLFVLCRPSVDWMRPTHIREADLINSVYQVKC